MRTTLTLTSKAASSPISTTPIAEVIVSATPEKAVVKAFRPKRWGARERDPVPLEPKTLEVRLRRQSGPSESRGILPLQSARARRRAGGRISADLDIKGEGKTWEALQKTLSGGTRVRGIEGALLKSNLTQHCSRACNRFPWRRPGSWNASRPRTRNSSAQTRPIRKSVRQVRISRREDQRGRLEAGSTTSRWTAQVGSHLRRRWTSTPP